MKTLLKLRQHKPKSASPAMLVKPVARKDAKTSSATLLRLPVAVKKPARAMRAEPLTVTVAAPGLEPSVESHAESEASAPRFTPAPGAAPKRAATPAPSQVQVSEMVPLGPLTPTSHTEAAPARPADPGLRQTKSVVNAGDEDGQVTLKQLETKVDALAKLIENLPEKLAKLSQHRPDAHNAGLGDPVRGLDVNEASTLLGISRATFYELRKQPNFVRPIHVGKRSVRYARADLVAWQEAQKTGDQADRPDPS